MMFVDVYDDEGRLVRSFDIETHEDWIDYLDWFDMQMACGHFLTEITRYQQEN